MTIEFRGDIKIWRCNTTDFEINERLQVKTCIFPLKYEHNN